MTDVRVPDDCRIGERGEGWRASLTTLMNERTAIGGGGGGGTPKVGSGPISHLVKLWHGLPDEQTGPAERDELMKLWVRAEVLRLTNVRAVQAAKSGQPGPEGSVAKLAGAELNKDIYSYAMNLQGMAGQIDFDYTFRRPGIVDLEGASGGLGYAFLRARANSIEGGTSEVLRNIMGEQMLGLPGEPRVDKDVAWADVPKN
jgi:alkylation response protein AidB-like acyl-CoA dehydrogenase